jgi:hypothetical protein
MRSPSAWRPFYGRQWHRKETANCVVLKMLPHTGGRYQLTIPGHLEAEKIVHALRSLAATEDEEGLFYPHRLLVTMTLSEADSWKERLGSMTLQQRLADRDALLAT